MSPEMAEIASSFAGGTDYSAYGGQNGEVEGESDVTRENGEQQHHIKPLCLPPPRHSLFVRCSMVLYEPLGLAPQNPTQSKTLRLSDTDSRTRLKIYASGIESMGYRGEFAVCSTHISYSFFFNVLNHHRHPHTSILSRAPNLLFANIIQTPLLFARASIYPSRIRRLLRSNLFLFSPAVVSTIYLPADTWLDGGS
ncbi:hypothetical protein C8R44DRAFT_881163 [Mycena epipterygia]|nr:hypothetical protein C8R44DRAFT_881163 [Mycena epipterygia]